MWKLVIEIMCATKECVMDNHACALCDADKCTNVLSQSEDWEAIVGFCDRINKDPDGPHTALKLLVHKMQSPQEKESLLALTVSYLLLINKVSP